MKAELRASAIAHYDQLARIGKALSSPARLHLIDLLRQGPSSVEVVSAQAGITVANASQHLQVLRTARLVVSERQGQHVVYRLSNRDVSVFFGALRGLGEALLPELDRLGAQLGVLDEQQRAAVLERIGGGRVTLLDVRPLDEYDAGHLPGALSIPLFELKARLAELPKSREVVAYCRGPYCPLAVAAVEVLAAAGFKARHLDLGAPDLAARRVRLVVSGSARARGESDGPARRRNIKGAP